MHTALSTPNCGWSVFIFGVLQYCWIIFSRFLKHHDTAENKYLFTQKETKQTEKLEHIVLIYTIYPSLTVNIYSSIGRTIYFHHTTTLYNLYTLTVGYTGATIRT